MAANRQPPTTWPRLSFSDGVVYPHKVGGRLKVGSPCIPAVGLLDLVS